MKTETNISWLSPVGAAARPGCGSLLHYFNFFDAWLITELAKNQGHIVGVGTAVQIYYHELRRRSEGPDELLSFVQLVRGLVNFMFGQSSKNKPFNLNMHCYV